MKSSHIVIGQIRGFKDLRESDDNILRPIVRYNKLILWVKGKDPKKAKF